MRRRSMRAGRRSPGRWARALAGATALLAVGCASGSGGGAGPSPVATGPAARPLAERMEALLAEPPFDGASWGVLVRDLGSGRVLYERNPSGRFIPASNAKTLLSVAALGILGPEHRWRTDVYATDPPGDGVLDGDLVIAGSGDPTLGAPFHEPAELALRALADSIAIAGIRRVTGDLVLDLSRWDSTSVPGSWMVEDLNPAVGATGGAFVFAQGELEVTVVAGDAPGEEAWVWWEPGIPSERIRARVLTVAEGDEGPGILAGYLPESRVWELGGAIVVGDSTSFRLSMRDPVRTAVELLVGAIEEAGVYVEGETRLVWEPLDPGDPAGDGMGYACAAGVIAACDPLVRITGWSSPPLGRVVSETLGPSQNWVAEQIVRTLGAAAGARGSWAEGTRAVASYLTNVVGVDAADLRIEDGSGLSVKNLVTPRALGAVLEHAWNAPWRDDFLRALPTPGQTGTTLETRLTDLEKRIFAKTGTLTNVATLAGYLFGDDGRVLTFAIFANGTNLPNSVSMARIDALVREVAREVVREGG